MSEEIEITIKLTRDLSGMKGLIKSDLLNEEICMRTEPELILKIKELLNLALMKIYGIKNKE